jgi:hypothetical protein
MTEPTRDDRDYGPTPTAATAGPTSWYESRIDRAIREAQERGDFDNLPGAGKPLRNTGDVHDDEWWIKQLAAREDLSAALPPALALRREVERLPATLAKKNSEAAVRAAAEDLNERILRARRGPVEGPPVSIGTVDVERAVASWRAAR